jgi:hypothetical protein
MLSSTVNFVVSKRVYILMLHKMLRVHVVSSFQSINQSIIYSYVLYTDAVSDEHRVTTFRSCNVTVRNGAILPLCTFLSL